MKLFFISIPQITYNYISISCKCNKISNSLKCDSKIQVENQCRFYDKQNSHYLKPMCK